MFKSVLSQGGIDLNHGHRFTAALAAPEVKRADINARIAEDGSNSPDHTGHIVIVHHQHITARDRLDAKVVDLGDAPFALALRDAEHGTRD